MTRPEQYDIRMRMPQTQYEPAKTAAAKSGFTSIEAYLQHCLQQLIAGETAWTPQPLLSDLTILDLIEDMLQSRQSPKQPGVPTSGQPGGRKPMATTDTPDTTERA